jgi:outer membrane immunogenic protein
LRLKRLQSCQNLVDRGQSNGQESFGKVMIINRISLILLSLFIPSIALAADLPSRAPLPTLAVASPTWTGFYVGLNLGWMGASGTDTGNWTANGVPIQAGSVPFGKVLFPYTVHSQNGGLAIGVTGGYNYQINSQFVAGFEADISGLALTGSQGSAPNFNATNINTIASCVVNCLGQTFNSQWLGLATQRARIGYLVNPSWMAYVTGGVAEALVHDRYQTVLTVANQDNWRFGFTVGLGTEYLLSQNISVKGELLYVGLGSSSVTQPIATLGKTTIGTSNKFSDHSLIVRTGLQYHF